MERYQPGCVRRSGAAATRGILRGGGFTLVELVLVIVIIGIIATVAAPRFSATGAYAERGFYDELASALRYAQKIALASGCPVRVDISAAGYVLGQQAALAGHCDPADAGFATPVRLPDGQAVAGTTPAGVAVAPAVSFTFDPGGRSGLAADQIVTVGVRTLVVQAESGLVITP